MDWLDLYDAVPCSTFFAGAKQASLHFRLRINRHDIRFEGQVTVFHPGTEASPCYRCLYNNDATGTETCTQTGVVAPLLGIIGSVQALETLKVLMGVGQDLTGRLLLLDALAMEWHSMRFRRDPRCPVCAPLVTAAAAEAVI